MCIGFVDVSRIRTGFPATVIFAGTSLATRLPAPTAFLSNSNSAEQRGPGTHRRPFLNYRILTMPICFRLEWFFLLDVRDVTIPIVIGIVKLGEGVIMWRALHPNIIDADFFMRLQVVINNHSPRADDGHLADLPRLEPAALDGGKAFMS